MRRGTHYTVQGQVRAIGRKELAALGLVVLAYIDGQQVARAEVGPKGAYKLSFDWAETPPVTELRVVPGSLAGPVPAHRAGLSPTVCGGGSRAVRGAGEGSPSPENPGEQ